MIRIKAPASKSCAQRAIVCATLAGGLSVVGSVGQSEDVRAAIGACRLLGATITQVDDDLHINGTEKLQSGIINVGESGLLIRLIAPVAALAGGVTRFIGHSTLNSRPMDALIRQLVQFGVEVVSRDGIYMPIEVSGAAHPALRFHYDGKAGSQVLSGLLTALPLVSGDRIIEVTELNSKPYIDLTINILNHFGIKIETDGFDRFIIRGDQHFRAANYTVEGDWSSASYFLVADAITGGGKIEVTGLDQNSTQADRAILLALQQARGMRAFEFDATHCPDLFPSLVALASFCEGESRIIGTSRLAHKESARDLVLKKEWAKFGIKIDLLTDNTMIIKGIPNGTFTQTSPIDPHGDHRIAMAAAIMGRDVEIITKNVVAKSFPQFWVEHQRIKDLLK